MWWARALATLGWAHAEVDELGDDVSPDDGGEFGVFAFFWTERLPVGEGAFDMMQPAAGFGQLFQALAVERSLERAAVGVAAEDDVLYLQYFDCVLDGCGDAVDIIAAYGDDVADAARKKEITGTGLEDEVRQNARVGASDEEPLRVLHLGQQMKLLSLAGKAFAMKALMPFNQLLHRGVYG